FQGSVLLALTVSIHCFALSWLFVHLEPQLNRVRLSFSRFMWLLVRIAAVTVLAHLVEILLWAMFFSWKGALPNIEVSFYFSAVTYATIGYGDVVLPQAWRLLAGIEGLTGILMCGMVRSILLRGGQQAPCLDAIEAVNSTLPIQAEADLARRTPLSAI